MKRYRLPANDAVTGCLVGLALGVLPAACASGPAGVATSASTAAPAALVAAAPVRAKACAAPGYDAAAFVADKVHILAGGFSFPNNGYNNPQQRLGYNAPQSDGTAALSNVEKGTLIGSYKKLPQYARDELCNNVTAVFVDPNADNFGGAQAAGMDGSGWAFWEVTADQLNAKLNTPVYTSTSDQGSGQNRYIAISKSALDAITDLQTLETQSLVTLSGVALPKLATMVKLKTLSNDGSDTAIAAIILHELGHLFWYEQCYLPSSPGGVSPCQQFFAQPYYKNWVVDLQWPTTSGTGMPGIHVFGDDLGSKRYLAGNTGIKDVANDHSGNALEHVFGLDNAAPTMQTGSRWPTLLSAVAQDEDFAETYKILGLDACGVDLQTSFLVLHMQSRDWHKDAQTPQSDLFHKFSVMKGFLGLGTSMTAVPLCPNT